MNAEAGAASALVTGVSALVSGATGFLGGHLATKLLGQGLRVRALARTTSDISGLVKAGIEIALGDISDRESLQHAMEGQRLVFHTAGKVTDWGAREDFWKTNVDGTANVIAACRSAGVKRLIYISSLTVLGLPRSGVTVDESTPPLDTATDPYTASKRAAEKLVLEAHTAELETVVIRPGAIWGPGDTTFLPRLSALLQRRKLVYIGRGENRIGLAHVDNLCDGIIRAARTPAAAGQVYHITDGEEMTCREAFTGLARALGVPPPSRSVPFAALYALATILESAARIRKSPTPPALTRYGVRLFASDCRYDIRKARTELGYVPAITFAQGINACIPRSEVS